MASPQLVWQLSKDFFRRNNPLDMGLSNLTRIIHNLITFNSQMKLLKFRFLLYQQQLQSMEHHLHDGSPYQVQGQRLNKSY